jgi:hypothetical protein
MMYLYASYTFRRLSATPNYQRYSDNHTHDLAMQARKFSDEEHTGILRRLRGNPAPKLEGVFPISRC